MTTAGAEIRIFDVGERIVHDWQGLEMAASRIREYARTTGSGTNQR